MHVMLSSEGKLGKAITYTWGVGKVWECCMIPPKRQVSQLQTCTNALKEAQRLIVSYAAAA